MDPYAWAWDLEALVLVPGLLVGYLIGTRGIPRAPWRLASFLAGLALILVVSISPLQTLALEYLLSAHLLQNVVLAEWAPALCVLGVPAALATRLTSFRLPRALTHPFVALPVWLGTYFAWHLPPAYDAALRDPGFLLHVEHACYFASGCLLWWPAVHDQPHSLNAGTRAAYLFAAFVLASPLGLLLALLPDAVYDFYEAAPRLWGLSPLSDQQLGGLTMAAEQAVVFFIAFAYFFLRFLKEEESREEEQP